MERRRLQFTGGTSYTVTLPKDWVMTNGLEKNDPIYVTALGEDALMIRPCESSVSPLLDSITISADGIAGETLYRRIIGAYVSGYTEIRIESAGGVTQELLDMSKDLSDHLMGMGVCETSDAHILLRDFNDITELSPSKGMERMKVAMRNILNDISNSMKLGVHMGNLRSRDAEVDRIRLLISRQASILNSSPSLYPKAGLDPVTMLNMVSLAAIIEDVGDVCVSMNSTLKNIHDRSAMAEIARIMDALDITGMFVALTDAVLNRSLATAEHLIAVCKSACERASSTEHLSSKYGLNDVIAINTLVESIRKILGFEVDLCELAIDVSIGHSV